MGSEFLAVAMYMDEATIQHYFNGGTVGIDNQGWTGRVVPLAPSSAGEWIALKKFARAHRARYVTGPPKYLVSIRIPVRFAVEHFLAGDIKRLEDRPEETVGFTRPVNTTNYPSMKAEVTKIDTPDGPNDLLEAGYQLLG